MTILKRQLISNVISIRHEVDVIDAGVWIRLARSGFAKPLIMRCKQYKMLPVLNNYLLSEVHDALLKNKWATINKPIYLYNT